MRFTLFLSAVIMLGLTGCSRTLKFDLDVSVTNDADGSPVEGATIRRNMWGEKTDPKTPETELHTDRTGQAREQFTVTDSAFSASRPKWYLRVSKDGFHTEIVEFKPDRAPAETATRLAVEVKLRPLTK